MSHEYLGKAIELVRRAAEEDNKKNYEQAYQLYMNSLGYFEHVVKYEKNERSKQAIQAKMGEYIARAQTLKEALSKMKKQAVPLGETGGKRDSDDDDKDKKEDSETKKLKDALSGAIVTETPNVHWEDIAGLDMAKEALKEAVILPMRFPDLFTGKRTPWRGILLFGPPGTGKTYLAKAVATEAKATFLSVSSSDLISKWMGESEKLVRQLFTMAREKKPAIIFIDEIDSIAGSRSEGENEASRRVKTEFLVQMQGVGNDSTGVLMLAATNLPWQLDPAVRRRFERRIYIPLPDLNARMAMFRIHVGKEPVKLTVNDYKSLAQMTEGYSGSDIAVVVRDALMQPVRKVQLSNYFRFLDAPSRSEPGKVTKHIAPCEPGDRGAQRMAWTDIPDNVELLEPEVTAADFFEAIRRAKKSVAPQDIERHIEWTEEFGQEG
ncbi:AAA-domain-containing protein [Gonapodya prolifera JEL478]|uniref:vesicle-fusing ATPase n=1 Tax=Gonapodya prolifera (strain JEL478) TaxID=1344416 RepID=A0A139APB4_GONPJ|nr:AAA-domain-containing protein [Gonapodya prolifera JEL478]|eukprot:KXS18484.1 AAA-domain-containing protein [Gonapodya prolifera JEL478]